ncbi:MAG: family 43 glycosylhydrolase [Akkermansiaceae bacterium]|jgi:hypothetical protein|nr:family 43 glycosylhydrolase [Akkermansiaceae bacterium]
MSRIVGCCLLLIGVVSVGSLRAENDAFRPGRPWLDTKGEPINAHGFAIVKSEGIYYWYGSHKIAGRTESEKNEAGVRCYTSKDLLNWTDAGLVLSVTSEGQHPEVRDAGILDRPKVIYHPGTRKFVMYFKLYPPGAAGDMVGTEVAYVGVATADRPTGPFKYDGKFAGAESPSGSGDFAVFRDDDGSFHHVAVRKPDKALVVGRMRKDGLRPEGKYEVMKGITHATEAPALFKRQGKYYLLGSASTGWKPNPARMFIANRLSGPWRSLGNPCEGINPHNKLGPEKTFGGQSTFVMPSPWATDEWIAMFDIWNPEEPIKAGYIWLPLRFENQKPVIRWQNEWRPAHAVPRDVHQIAVNQIGYEVGRPMRFTAPLTENGTAFIVRPAKGGEPVFQGEIQDHIGDFSTIKADAGEYVIEIRDDKLKPGVSDPFFIQPDLWKQHFWQPAVDFLIDSRSVVGTHPSAYGGCPWRDGTYYDAILPALVLFHRADPARIAAMPRQIDWHADKKRVMDPAFKFDAKNPCSEGVMEAVRKYYTEIEPPADDAPDVVKLIHWGAGFYLVNPATKDPSQDPDPRQIHAQTVEQVAYVVWAWPELLKWLPKSFYEKCRTFCEQNWEPSLGIGKWWGPGTYLKVSEVSGDNPMGGLLHPYKGRHAPGHSIVPNLLMHEVAKRDGLADPGRYLSAAVKQAEWIIKNLDWNDPRTTKGHRMSEHRTIPHLVWLLTKYPEHAPAGLREKITAWAEVAAKRSDNLWDIRRFDDGEHWTIPKLNDVGNWVGTPGIAISASWVIEDPALKARMREIAITHADAVFGRNPRLAAAPHKPQMGFPMIERGWPIGHKENVCARLELCRGSISAAPGSEMFPFFPEAGYRHAEGWVNYGAAWCLSLAYLAHDEAKSHP